MGYCSTFRIVSKNGPISRVVDLLHEQKNWGQFVHLRSISSPANAELGEIEFIEWYEMEAELQELTKNHTWMHLEVSRTGEEPGDIEFYEFCLGNCCKVKAKISYSMPTSWDPRPDIYPGDHDLSHILDKIENGQLIDKREMVALRTMLKKQ